MLELMTGSLLKKISGPGLEIDPSVFQKLLAADGATNDIFGYNVAVSADESTIIVSASQDDDKGDNSGSVYIFTKQVNGSYLQTQKLLASDGEATDYFGSSVAVSGDGSTVVADAYRDDDKDSDSGSAYVFIKQLEGNYLQVQKLIASDGARADYFGRSVAVSNTSVVVGAYNHLSKGAVYVY